MSLRKTKKFNPIPVIRIANPISRNIELRYRCPNTGRKIRKTTHTRDIKVAEQKKRELEAKFLLGLTIEPDTHEILGPDMEWSYFRELYRSHHLISLKDNTAAHIESRLDLAEKIVQPKYLKDMSKYICSSTASNQNANRYRKSFQSTSIAAYC